MKYYIIKLMNGREFIIQLSDKDITSTEFQTYHGSGITRTVLTQSGLDKFFSLPSLHDTPNSNDLVFTIIELSDEYVNWMISNEENTIRQSEQRIAKLSRLLPSLSESTTGYLEL